MNGLALRLSIHHHLHILKGTVDRDPDGKGDRLALADDIKHKNDSGQPLLGSHLKVRVASHFDAAPESLRDDGDFGIREVESLPHRCGAIWKDSPCRVCLA